MRLAVTLAFATLVGVIAAKKKIEELGPPPSLFSDMKDFLLFSGAYSWAYWVSLTGYCITVVNTVQGGNAPTNYGHGLALCILTGFGGSTLAAIMCGLPVVFTVNQSLVTVMTIVWTALYFGAGVFSPVLKMQPVKTVTSLLYEMMRTHVMMNCAAMAFAELNSKTSAAYPVAFVGPLIAGLLGGCGGGFMPLNKGLEPVEKGTNWRIESAAIGSLWLQLAGRDPNTKPYFVAAFGALDDYNVVRAFAVAFFMITPMIGMYVKLPFGANPLVPARKSKTS